MVGLPPERENESADFADSTDCCFNPAPARGRTERLRNLRNLWMRHPERFTPGTTPNSFGRCLKIVDTFRGLVKRAENKIRTTGI
jgi:hypothetical protein